MMMMMLMTVMMMTDDVDDCDNDDDDDDDTGDRSCLDGDDGGSEISVGSGKLVMLMIMLQVMLVALWR